MPAMWRLNQPIQEEEAEDEELYTGNNIPEFTQLLMTTLEEKTSQEPWDPELRISLNDQLVEFLKGRTPQLIQSILVNKYEEQLMQLTSSPKQAVEGKVWR